jgi:hypothetical protein
LQLLSSLVCQAYVGCFFYPERFAYDPCVLKYVTLRVHSVWVHSVYAITAALAYGIWLESRWYATTVCLWHINFHPITDMTPRWVPRDNKVSFVFW